MGSVRRGAPDPQAGRIRAAFDGVADHIVSAQRALLAAIPTPRDEGVPLAQALAAFGEHLRRAEAAMPSWRAESVLHEWTTCSRALGEARAEAERLRVTPQDLGFERLNERVGDVLHPLETFGDAERALRRL
jgi:hypothetical protein